ncbi:MAG: CsbD family protein [Nitrospira sp.]|nr:CsbD family protein [Nitrospira sp.]HNP27840.1 CsbD family protein [Nitrospirales bacterium]
MKISHDIAGKKVAAAFVSIFLLGSSAWAANGLTYSAHQEEGAQSQYIHKVYNEDQFNGNWKQLKGALKENWGEFTDDDLLAIEGRTDRFEGKLQERYGERKEEVRAWVDEWLEKHPYDAHDRER